MKLTDVKNVKVASYRQLVEMFDSLVERINTLTEAVIPVNPDLDIEQQLAELTKRMEAARRGLGLVNKFPAGPARTEHRKRIMGNLNTIRAMLGRVVKAQDQFNRAEKGYEGGMGYAQDFGKAVGEEEESWNDNHFGDHGGGFADDEELCDGCELPKAECECERDYGDEDYPDYEDSFDSNRFASKGSALHASDENDPREHECPTCLRPNKLTLRDVQAGYQCDGCADRAERGLGESRDIQNDVDDEDKEDKEVSCQKCGDTGYRANPRGGKKIKCEDCWSDNGPE